jgi:hypothetical protein
MRASISNTVTRSPLGCAASRARISDVFSTHSPDQPPSRLYGDKSRDWVDMARTGVN